LNDMLTNQQIQALYDRANLMGTDVVRWSDLFQVLAESRNPDTTNYTTKPVLFSDLPEYADDAAAVLDGHPSGALYRTSTGQVNQVLPAI
jgi:hypothetical protein